MPRLLLTGANGFVGKILTRRLQDAGYQVIALSSSESRADNGADEHLVCDIRDANALEQAVVRA